MANIKSKFRTGYFGGLAFVGIILLSGLAFLIYFLSTREQIDLTNLGPWTVFAMIGVILYCFSLIPRDLEEMIIDEKGITIRNSVYKKTTFIAFDSINKYSIQRAASRSKASNGYLIIHFELKDSQRLAISQHTYSNFFDIKDFVLDKLAKPDGADF